MPDRRAIDRLRRSWRRPRPIRTLLGAFLLSVVSTGVAGCEAVTPDHTDATGAKQAPGERLVLDETFDGTTLDRTRWNTCHWWDPERCTIASNGELEWYEPGQVRVEHGRLLLTAERSRAADRQTHPFLSGMVTTGPQAEQGPSHVAFVHGRVEVELELPRGRGLWPAVWMLPASTSARPEIDLVETVGSAPEEWLFHLHPKDEQAPSHGSSIRRPALARGKHTIGLDWQPGRLQWFVDGRRVWQVTGRDVPDEPMYLVIDLAVGGQYPGSPDASTPFPATLAVDRVRVWQ